MGNSFRGADMWRDYAATDTPMRDAPELPRLLHLRFVSMCGGCHAGMSKKDRCTRDMYILEHATTEELVNGVGAGAGCAIDRDAVLESRMRQHALSHHLPPKRPGILARLNLRRPPA